MTLRRTVAALFQREGRERVEESRFVVALSLDRDWFSADQARRVVDLAASEGLVVRDGDELVARFDPSAVDLPEEFIPEESVLRDRSTFERVLDTIVDSGIEKQEAVGDINAIQADLVVTVEAAAVLYAHRRGLDVSTAAERALEEL
jgi:hypothetical protein